MICVALARIQMILCYGNLNLRRAKGDLYLGALKGHFYLHHIRALFLIGFWLVMLAHRSLFLVRLNK